MTLRRDSGLSHVYWSDPLHGDEMKWGGAATSGANCDPDEVTIRFAIRKIRHTDGWLPSDDLGPSIELLHEAGRTYAPFMLANEAALSSGADEVVCEIADHEYRQGPFKYQGKCLNWIRDDYNTLTDTDRARVDAILTGTGCETLFA